MKGKLLLPVSAIAFSAAMFFSPKLPAKSPPHLTLTELEAKASASDEGPDTGTCCPLYFSSCTVGAYTFNDRIRLSSGPCP